VAPILGSAAPGGSAHCNFFPDVRVYIKVFQADFEGPFAVPELTTGVVLSFDKFPRDETLRKAAVIHHPPQASLISKRSATTTDSSTPLKT